MPKAAACEADEREGADAARRAASVTAEAWGALGDVALSADAVLPAAVSKVVVTTMTVSREIRL
ncbi:MULTISPECIES: hypothetical protein [unclassified Streptomyces]|nr:MULTISPECIES: hypothetical protein [unclassified Streptomyces]